MCRLGRVLCIAHSISGQTSQEGIKCTKAKEYSEVPNKQADRNKQADWHFFGKFINEQTGIFLKI